MQEDTRTGMIGTKQGFYESMNESTHYNFEIGIIMFKSKVVSQARPSLTLTFPEGERGSKLDRLVQSVPHPNMHFVICEC